MNEFYWNYYNSPPPLPAFVDCVLVINQETPIATITYTAEKHDVEELLIVSTHAPYPTEMEAIQSRLKDVTIYWRVMSSLLTDDEMQACDDEAVGALKGEPSANAIMVRSRTFRNEKARRNLSRILGWRFCYADTGLGIVQDAWPGAIHPENRSRKPAAFIDRLRGRVGYWIASCTAEVIDTGIIRYIFIGSTQRLRIKEQYEVRRFRRRPLQAILAGSGFTLGGRLISGTVAQLVKNKEQRSRVCTTVHNFNRRMLKLSPDLRVFVDGLHPPNYPVSYGAAYRGAIIVWRECYDRRWFERCGCQVEAPPEFIEEEPDYSNPSTSRPIENICLMLNHAGDWSALIDRSDTDLAVIEFAKAARSSNLSFRIRPHPTMAAAMHEGQYSRTRLIEWINSLGLPNLDASSGTLEEDMQWTDCCVSEYSDVLVDCMKAGKACVALNPTNRRNLLAHLEPHGLMTAHNHCELLQCLDRIQSRQ